MQPDMQRHKKIIPVAGKQMGDSGKPKPALNIQKSKKLIWKNDTAYHQKDCTKQNAAVYDSLHYAVGIVFAAEDSRVPATV